MSCDKSTTRRPILLFSPGHQTVRQQWSERERVYFPHRPSNNTWTSTQQKYKIRRVARKAHGPSKLECHRECHSMSLTPPGAPYQTKFRGTVSPRTSKRQSNIRPVNFSLPHPRPRERPIVFARSTARSLAGESRALQAGTAHVTRLQLTSSVCWNPRNDTTPWVKKTRHQTLGHNFTNYYPIFKIFSLTDSVVNLQQIHV